MRTYWYDAVIDFNLQSSFCDFLQFCEQHRWDLLRAEHLALSKVTNLRK